STTPERVLPSRRVQFPSKPRMDAPLLEYRHPTQPHGSSPPRTGFLLDASFLISIFTGVGTALVCCAIAIPTARSSYDRAIAIAWLCIALAILALEVGASYLRSVIASFILALAYLLVILPLLRILLILPGGVNS